MSTEPKSQTVHDVLITLGQPQGLPENLQLIPSPLLAALKDAGTAHIYADTANQEELAELLTVDRRPFLKKLMTTPSTSRCWPRSSNSISNRTTQPNGHSSFANKSQNFRMGTSSRCSIALSAGGSAATWCGPLRAAVRGK